MATYYSNSNNTIPKLNINSQFQINGQSVDEWVNADPNRTFSQFYEVRTKNINQALEDSLNLSQSPINLSGVYSNVLNSNDFTNYINFNNNLEKAKNIVQNQGKLIGFDTETIGNLNKPILTEIGWSEIEVANNNIINTQTHSLPLILDKPQADYLLNVKNKFFANGFDALNQEEKSTIEWASRYGNLKLNENIINNNGVFEILKLNTPNYDMNTINSAFDYLTTGKIGNQTGLINSRESIYNVVDYLSSQSKEATTALYIANGKFDTNALYQEMISNNNKAKSMAYTNNKSQKEQISPTKKEINVQYKKINNNSSKNIKKNEFYKSKKNSSSTGRIRAYKNKYNSPNINYSKYDNINETFINYSYQNNNRTNLENISNKRIFGHPPINDQFFNNRHYFTARYSTGNYPSNYTYINNQYNNLTFNSYNNILNPNDNLYVRNFEHRNLFQSKNNNINDDIIGGKMIKKSNSSSSLFFSNNEMDRFQRMKNEGKYEIIKIKFPREQIINNNKIKIIPGKLEVINPNKDIIKFIEPNKYIGRSNSHKQIINQENIIINNGFVNMSNNYYVNNNPKNSNEQINEKSKEKIKNNASQKIFIGNIVKNNSLNNIINSNNDINKEYINNNPMNKFENRLIGNNLYDYLNNHYQYNTNNNLYKSNVVYNNFNNDIFEPKINNINIENKSSNPKYPNNNKINNNIINNKNNKNNFYIKNEKINLTLNNNDYNNKFINNYNTDVNENKIYTQLTPRLKTDINYINYPIQSNPNNNPTNNYNNIINPNYINKDYLNDRNILQNNNSNNYTHQNCISKSPIKVFSNLIVQCSIQILIKKSKKYKLVRHKIISYYPQKLQIEIRPCYYFQPFKLKKKIPVPKNKIPIYPYKFLNKPLIPKKISPPNYANNNNNLASKKRIIHNKVKRRRPVFKIPPCKKAFINQGKSLTFIHKYYDENFILEEDDEEEKLNKSEKKKRIKLDKKIEKNYLSDNEENKKRKNINFKININIINMKNDNNNKSKI